MKLITVCSESHNQLLETHFLPSIPTTLTPIVERTKQHGNGRYDTEHFLDAMKDKLRTVIHYTKTEKDPFIYSDVDVRFNPLLNPVPILFELLRRSGSDMLCQRDWRAVCCGFMVIVPSKKNADYLQAVMDYMELPINASRKMDFHDQVAFNELYGSNHFQNVERPKITLIDATNGFGNMNHIQPGVLWEPNNDIIEKNKDLMKKQFMWHGNFTVGNENKMEMLERFKNAAMVQTSNPISDLLRPWPPRYGVYPPYNATLPLEDYFHKFAEGKSFNRQYIGVSWTTLYNDGTNIDVQAVLNRLPRDGSYFTVCQHDDAPQRHFLPKDTMIFSAGGNATRGNIIPIPLICSPIVLPNEDISVEKELLCSFVGSDTHPIRKKMIQQFENDDDFAIIHREWAMNVGEASLNLFKRITKRSVFALCPRGYGKTSFRMYEVMQMGAIPVYLSDDHYLPWADELDWNEFAVLVKEKDIPNIKTILLSYSEKKQQDMVNRAKQIYNDYFSLDGVCKQIQKRVNNQNLTSAKELRHGTLLSTP